METLKSFTHEKNGKEYQVTMILDEYPDLSYLGEFTDKLPDCNYFDRKDGYFIGFDGYLTHHFEISNITFPDGEDTTDSEIETVLKALYPNHEITEIIGLWINEDGSSDVEFAAREILAEIPSDYERHSYQYFVTTNHLNPDTTDSETEEYGKDNLKNDSIQDYKRMYDYNIGDWCSTFITVESDGVDASLGGVESDISQENLIAIVDELIAEIESMDGAK